MNRTITKLNVKKKQNEAGDEEVKERMWSLIVWNEKSATRKKSSKSKLSPIW